MGCAAVAGVVLALAQALFAARMAAGDGGVVEDVSRALGPVLGVTVAIAGPGALAGSALALRAGDRAPTVYLALAIGVAVTLIVVAELAVPH
jgi:hypothetical protein